ncbi:phage holin family protein [Yoonia vestfoldensis]|uniref:phage holin family protein n=1 Tax=Yoonia vestfoldensis TaxID=245188 RepID=UPI0013A5999D|nr:hypothetical protein [Yoonia vestfoldensis]
MRGVTRAFRKDAGRLLRSALLALAGGLTAAAGLAFLTVSGYLVLCLALGPGPAAFLIGVGLLVLAGGLLTLAGNRPANKTAAAPLPPQPAASATHETDFASRMAFTAAYVMARYLGAGRRDRQHEP